MMAILPDCYSCNASCPAQSSPPWLDINKQEGGGGGGAESDGRGEGAEGRRRLHRTKSLLAFSSADLRAVTSSAGRAAPRVREGSWSVAGTRSSQSWALGSGTGQGRWLHRSPPQGDGARLTLAAEDTPALQGPPHGPCQFCHPPFLEVSVGPGADTESWSSLG